MVNEQAPYSKFSAQHLDIRKRNACLLPFILVFVVLYMVTKSGAFIFSGAVYLISVFLLSRLDNERLYRKYQEIELEHINDLWKALSALRIASSAGEMAFGYLVTDEACVPVFLYSNGDSLYQFANIFTKHITYAVENKIIYVMGIDHQTLQKGFNKYCCSQIHWTLNPERHQQFLCKEGLRLNQPSTIENFIYDDILTDMLSHKKKRPMNTSLQLTRIKKEKLYAAKLNDWETLILTENSLTRLNICSEIKEAK